MKAFTLLTALLFTLPAFGAEGSGAFRDAFHAYVNLRRLEEKSQIAERRPDLEEGERINQARKLAAEITSARIDFQAFLRPGDTELSPWEQSVLKLAGASRLAASDKTALDFLSTAYPKAATAWSPAEWQCAADWFGTGVTDSFLKITFHMEEAIAGPGRAGAVNKVLWITDPAGLSVNKAEAASHKAKRAGAISLLKQKGFIVKEIEIHPFTRFDDQAEELLSALERSLKDAPSVVVSGGNASAVLLHTFDLNPRLLGDPAIRGWINVNGKLFSEAQTERAPASITKADRQAAEARRELLPLREERLERQMALSPKFPVVNLVSFGGQFRPGPSVRDSLVPEGKSLYLQNSDAVEALGAALPFIEGRAPPAGQRDIASDSSF
jgi:hypothetical protein